MNDDIVSIADAAAECGMTIAEFLEQMEADGLLMRDEHGNLIPGLHPDLQPVTPVPLSE